MKKTGLSALLAPHSTDEFLTSNWPKSPFVVHGLHESVQAITSLPILESLDTLLNSWPHLIAAHLPDVSDEASSIEVSPTQAKKLFANKMGLLFNHVHQVSPLLNEWLQEIKKDLGLPNSTLARCMVYATPDGKGTAPHFDQNVNFVLQLHGTKTWWLEENSSVINPTERHTIGQPIDPELESYLHAELPTQMSDAREKFILEPGSMLFVPRGYWHSTEAQGHALALNFTFNQPTWIDLFTLALRSRLLQSPEWRELADGVADRSPAKRKFAQQKLDELLAELVEDLPHWQAEDILAATEGQ